MNCLAIDTSRRECAVCVLDQGSGEILAEVSNSIGRGHAEHLMATIEQALDCARCTLSQIEHILVSKGPGSFTGIRVGIAAANGLALGLNVPVIGVSNLDVMLWLSAASSQSARTHHCALLSAGREDLYCLFDTDTTFAQANEAFVTRLDDAFLREVRDMSSLHMCMNGELADQLHETMPDLKERYETIIMPTDAPPVSAIARYGLEQFKDADAGNVLPLYLRKPDAKPQAGFAAALQKGG